MRAVFLGDGLAIGKAQEPSPRHVRHRDVATESFARPTAVGEEVSELSDSLHGWIVGGLWG